MQLIYILIAFVFSLQASNTIRFSKSSQLTLCTLTCGRIDLLALTWKSFFHSNTYPLFALIIIDDCQTEQKYLLQALPQDVRQHEQFISIYSNEKKIGVIPSVNRGMGLVKSKYLLWCQEDWYFNLRPNYIEDSISLLEESEQYSLGISQIIIGREMKRNHRLRMQFSEGGVAFYKFEGIIGFNPNIMRVKDIFIDTFNGDIVKYMKKVCRKECLVLPCPQCLNQKLYKDLINKRRQIEAAIIDCDCKERQTVHLGVNRRVNQLAESKIQMNEDMRSLEQIVSEQVIKNPLKSDTIILHLQQTNKLYGNQSTCPYQESKFLGYLTKGEKSRQENPRIDGLQKDAERKSQKQEQGQEQQQEKQLKQMLNQLQVQKGEEVEVSEQLALYVIESFLYYICTISILVLCIFKIRKEQRQNDFKVPLKTSNT